ncbi:retrovirus-related pol polyprotein from transposon TNT 1-94 [Tanacetum coccineum]
MSGTVPPIPPPFGASSGNPGSPNINRVDMMPITIDPINTTTTTNVAQSVADENLPQLLDSRGGSHVTNVPAFDKEDFTKMWNDLILAHEGPSDTRDTKIAALRLKFNAIKSLEGEKVMGTFTRMKCLLNDLENNGVTIPQAEKCHDSDSDVEEDQRTNNEFMADLNAEYHERALDRVKKGKSDKGKSEKGLTAESFNWDEEYVSSKDEGTTKIRAFMEIAEDEPSVGKADARSGQWVDITMKKDEISDLKRVIEKWTCSKVTLDQLLSEQIRGNIVKALGGKGRIKENNSSKEVLFTKANVSTSGSAPMITSNSEDDSDIQEPLSPLPKLTKADPSGASKSLISLSDLTANMADLTLNTASKEIKKSSNKVSQTYVIKKRTESKHPTVQNSCPDKNALLSTEQLFFNSGGRSKSSKTPKQKVWYGPCKHCGKRNHLSDDCYSKLKCSTCGSISYTTKEHTKQSAVTKSLNKLKGHSTSKSTPIRTARMSKTFRECKYCGSNKHHPDDCEFYLGCEICGSIAHEIADCPKNLRNNRKQRIAIKQSEPTKNGCSRYMTGVKQYLHRYSKEPGPKVVFRDDSLGDTEGYGSVNCNGITFTRVAYVNRLKRKLISISQQCDANFKVLFTKTQGTIFNQNDEVVLIAPRRRDVYIIDMSSFNKESNTCFLAKASPRVNWLWHKRLSHLNFKNINNLAKHNLVSGLPSLTISKDKNYSTCEKGKHHREAFKTKRSFSINKSLHLLHMDLFGPVKPQTISYKKYTLVIVDEYSRKMENLNEVRVKELRSDNRTEFKNHKLEEFCDEKGIS